MNPSWGLFQLSKQEIFPAAFPWGRGPGGRWAELRPGAGCGAWLACAGGPEGPKRSRKGEVVGPRLGSWGRGGRAGRRSRGAGSRDAELPGGSPAARGRSQPVAGQAAGRVCSTLSAREGEGRQLVVG